MRRKASACWLWGKALLFLAAFTGPTVLISAEALGRDRVTVTYGLREYAEYNDNLFNTSEGDDSEEKIDDTAINTAPDLSIVYDDGETRWLARGTFRRESFLDNSDASGNYWAVSGEFSRRLNSRVSFGLLGSYTDFASLELGTALTEPGQDAVFRPVRGRKTTGTFWSPSLTVFWSRRFSTSLSYEDNQTFTQDSTNRIDRTISLGGVYGLSRNTTLKGSLIGFVNRNSGLPFADRQDANSFIARFGFVHVLTPRLTIDFSAGPQWTKEVNLPDNVTLLRNGIIAVPDRLFGTTTQQFIAEPGRAVEDVTLGLSLNLEVSYVWSPKTTMALLVTQGTTSGEGAAGTQETRNVQFTYSHNLYRNWSLGFRGSFTRRRTLPNDFLVLTSKNPDTGEIQALDRKSFDLDDSFETREITFEPRLSYRINKWLTAYTSWNWTELKQETLGSRSQVNRVQMGLEFRRDAYY